MADRLDIFLTLGYYTISIINRELWRHVMSKRSIKYKKIYTAAHGRIPDGYHIHHIDYNSANNSIENLIAIPGYIHNKLHAVFRSPLSREQILEFWCGLVNTAMQSTFYSDHLSNKSELGLQELEDLIRVRREQLSQES